MIKCDAKLMLFLADAPGPFPVGATTFVTSVPAPRQVGSIRLRGNDQPALSLSEVAFTVYYPTVNDISKSTRKGLEWVLRPLNKTLRGFVKFTGISFWLLWPVFYLFGAWIRIPVYPNAPLARPKESSSENEDGTFRQWPLVIFSHGLGGSRTAYSQICSRLASSGRVVLAMEHRDGTGCACITRDRSVYYYKEHDVIIDDTNTSAPLPLRTAQLEFRCEEIYIAYQSFSNFLNGDSVDMDTIDNQSIDRTSWVYIDLFSNKRPVCFDKNVILAGHSFGGCTMLSILSSSPPSGYPPIPVSHALIFDPWLEPLPLPGPVPISLSQNSVQPVAFSTPDADANESPPDKSQSGQAGRDGRPQMLVINSEVFTLWKDHYARLEGIVKTWEPEGGRLLTLVSSRHEEFSDFPSLPIIRSSTANTIMNIISRLSIAFLDNKLEEALGSSSTREMEINIIGRKKDGKPKRKLIGNVGDVIVA